MTCCCQALLLAYVAVSLSVGWAVARPPHQETAAARIATDPQTGRAVGAKEMAPEALRALIDQKAAVIIIDVRDEAQFAQETIKGAVHIPFAELEARLKEIPKDTVLAFT
jgi:3-mercaptopyruvate sulfurtransferase SseA